jgi:hypothetical protein
MRHGEVSVQEYDIQANKIANAYALDKPLVIRGDVNSRIVGQIHPVGRDAVIANFRRVTSVHYSTFRSGRLKVSASGEKLLAVVPTGVYMFTTRTQTSPADAATPKRRINVIETDSSKTQ